MTRIEKARAARKASNVAYFSSRPMSVARFNRRVVAPRLGTPAHLVAVNALRVALHMTPETEAQYAARFDKLEK